MILLADGEVQSIDDSITGPNSDIEVGVKAAEKVVSRLVMRRENQPGGLGKLSINICLVANFVLHRHKIINKCTITRSCFNRETGGSCS